MFGLGMVGLFIVGVFTLYFWTRRPRRNRLPLSPDTRPPIAVEHARAGNGKPPARRAAPPRHQGFQVRWVSSRHLLDAHRAMAAFDCVLKSGGQEPPWQNAEEFEQYTHQMAILLQQTEFEWPSPERLDGGRPMPFLPLQACDGATPFAPDRGVAFIPVPVPSRLRRNGVRSKR